MKIFLLKKKLFDKRVGKGIKLSLKQIQTLHRMTICHYIHTKKKLGNETGFFHETAVNISYWI